MGLMRKRYRVLLMAALVAALVVPVGFALSLESPGTAPIAQSAVMAKATVPAANMVTSPVLNHHPQSTPAAPLVRDSVRLLLVGSVLFGLAAFVRNTI
jgi:hypothetical protein